MPEKCSITDPISTIRLKTAFDRSLSILGLSSKEALLCDLQEKGIDLEGSGSYSLKQIEAAFKTLFGSEVTELLIQRLWKALEKEE